MDFPLHKVGEQSKPGFCVYSLDQLISSLLIRLLEILGRDNQSKFGNKNVVLKIT